MSKRAASRLRSWTGGYDPWLLLALALLAALGMVVLHSAGAADAQLAWRHGIRLGVGLALLLAIAQMPPPWLRSVSPWLFLGSIILLLLVALFGEGRGAQSWLRLGPLRFQPSELVKLSLPMMLAWLLHSQTLPPRLGVVLAALGVAAVPVLLIAEQPDLGTAVLVAASAGCLIFLAGLSWRWILGLIGTLSVAAPVLWHFMWEHQRNRIRTFLDPEADPLGHGWNVIQAKIAVGSGGLSGKGYMQGTQSQLDFLPEHTTDFAVAVLAEEFGFVGICLLLVLCVLIGVRGVVIANRARDTYSRLLAGTLALTFLVYVLVNTAMVAGLVPVVGVPMPFISYGGTSTVTLLTGFGIILGVNRHQHRRRLRRQAL